MKKRGKKPSSGGQTQPNPPAPTQSAQARPASIKDVEVLQRPLTRREVFGLTDEKPPED